MPRAPFRPRSAAPRRRTEAGQRPAHPAGGFGFSTSVALPHIHPLGPPASGRLSEKHRARWQPRSFLFSASRPIPSALRSSAPSHGSRPEAGARSRGLRFSTSVALPHIHPLGPPASGRLSEKTPREAVASLLSLQRFAPLKGARLRLAPHSVRAPPLRVAARKPARGRRTQQGASVSVPALHRRTFIRWVRRPPAGFPRNTARGGSLAPFSSAPRPPQRSSASPRAPFRPRSAAPRRRTEAGQRPADPAGGFGFSTGVAPPHIHPLGPPASGRLSEKHRARR